MLDSWWSYYERNYLAQLLELVSKAALNHKAIASESSTSGWGNGCHILRNLASLKAMDEFANHLLGRICQDQHPGSSWLAFPMRNSLGAWKFEWFCLLQFFLKELCVVWTKKLLQCQTSLQLPYQDPPPNILNLNHTHALSLLL